MTELPDRIPDSAMYPTLNSYGIVTSELDEYTQEFVDFCKGVSGPVLEIGVGYGFSTIAALKNGVKVVANDLDERHLNILLGQVPKELRENLTLSLGCFPGDIDFAQDSFDAIHAARVFHFLMAEDFRAGMEKIVKWLKPEGKVYITAETPYLSQFKDKFLKEYEEKVKSSEEWPGLLFGFIEKYCPEEYKHLAQDDVNLMDPTVFRRECERVGLVVEKVGFFARTDIPEKFKVDGREGVGVIAQKHSRLACQIYR